MLTFPTHASEFHYTGMTSVRYTIRGNQLTFDVQLPAGCVKDHACWDAFGWAPSAFFEGTPWTRT